MGKRRLDAAIAQLQAKRPAARVDVSFQPFMIDPGTAEGGEDYLAYNRRRWGSDGWTRGLRASGAPDGCAFGNWRFWPNTYHANRLLMLAEAQGLGGQCKDALFRRCYEDGENVSSREAVAAVARTVGVAGGEAHVMSNAGTSELGAALMAARARGVRSVPFFLVESVAPGNAGEAGQPYEVSGAQTTGHWLAILEQLCDEA